MRIYNIQPTTITKQQNNFRGLWGKETTEWISQAGYDAAQNCDMGINHSITKKISSFLRWNNWRDSRGIKNNTKNHSYTKSMKDDVLRYPNQFIDCSTNIKEMKVKLMPRLGFSAAEFKLIRQEN